MLIGREMAWWVRILAIQAYAPEFECLVPIQNNLNMVCTCSPIAVEGEGPRDSQGLLAAS